MIPATYSRLQTLARACAWDASSAEDLLHDALLVAARKQVNMETEDGRRWLTGVLRNLARQHARGEGRRQQREEDYAMQTSAPSTPSLPDELATPTDLDADALWATLPPSVRSVVVLALHGLDKPDIRAALGISDTALRQRLRVARRALGTLPADLQRDALARAYARRQRRADTLDLGLIRRALSRRLSAEPKQGTLGIHDPDGHLIVVSTRRS
ncbi:MAG: hypothetical protein AAGN64_04385 [Bacteroidota bacterium]